MGRLMPVECPHGNTVDWGDFGPCQDCADHGVTEDCPNFVECEQCVTDAHRREREARGLAWDAAYAAITTQRSIRAVVDAAIDAYLAHLNPPEKAA